MTLMQYQTGILTSPVPDAGRHLFFKIQDAKAVPAALARLQEWEGQAKAVLGMGKSLTQALGKNLPLLRVFPALTGPAVEVPSTQKALWCWLYGTDRGKLLLQGQQLQALLMPAFELVETLDSFRYLDGHDLSGYEDGTENPQDEDALAAILAEDAPGGTYVAVQKWQHNLARMAGFAQQEQDHIIGRRLSDNEELEEAPEFAHVKRTAQESFEPEAFMVRKSMPWIEGERSGLHFVSFVKNLDAFEVQLRRMVGEEDAIVDGLFRFSQPLTGGYYWCPPVKNGKLDLSFLLS
ncbi:Dyp-type peroxidase [Pseudomonas sp. F1_0610]|uniref:Dyp-type peroxidase n=1 Tax=Pseudomonas sp. F1_0610 TaxID=3114284 RepID=UPI0039C4705B